LVHFTNPILQKSLLRPNNGEWWIEKDVE
jgi:hypothetical protein